MLNDKQRADLVKEAWSWVGTPYRGWSAVKGAGTDCAQMLYAIYQNCGYVPKDIDLPTDYSLQVNQHKPSVEYIEFVRSFMSELTNPDELELGDVICFQIDKGFSHGAILVEKPFTVIHALSGSGVRAANALKHPGLLKAKRRYFTLKDVYCNRATSPPVAAKKKKGKGKTK
jgi:cell wall-associated NlpC family hydrolase